MQIDWRIKSLLFRVFQLFPADTLYFAQGHLTRRSCITATSIEKYRHNWDFHKDNIIQFGAKTVIEFGAGKNMIQNLYLSGTGVTQTLVDLNRMIRLPQINAAIEALTAKGLLEKRAEIRSVEDLQTEYGIIYRAPYDMRGTDLSNYSFDICISTSTLEHIPAPDILAIMGELRRILVQGGVISAVIDYSDHYWHTDRKISPLNYLRFSQAQWRRHNSRNHPQNRLRHAHYKELFERAGLTIEYSEATNYCTIPPNDINPDCLTGDDTDFALTGFWRLRT